MARATKPTWPRWIVLTAAPAFLLLACEEALPPPAPVIEKVWMPAKPIIVRLFIDYDTRHNRTGHPPGPHHHVDPDAWTSIVEAAGNIYSRSWIRVYLVESDTEDGAVRVRLLDDIPGARGLYYSEAETDADGNLLRVVRYVELNMTNIKYHANDHGVDWAWVAAQVLAHEVGHSLTYCAHSPDERSVFNSGFASDVETFGDYFRQCLIDKPRPY